MRLGASSERSQRLSQSLHSAYDAAGDRRGAFHEADTRKAENVLKNIRLHEIKMQNMRPLNLRKAFTVEVSPWAAPLVVALVEADGEEVALFCLRSSMATDGEDEDDSSREGKSDRPGSPSSSTRLCRTPQIGQNHFLLAAARVFCSSTAAEMLPISLGWVGMKLRRDRIKVRKFQFGFHIS